MNGLVALFSEAWVQRLGWVLIHFLWQGTGIALLLAVALRILTRASAHVRYIVIGSALLLCAVIPMATWMMLEPATVAPFVPAPVLPETASAPVESGLQAKAVVETALWSTGNAGMGWEERLSRCAETALPYVVGLWFGGVLILTLRLTLGWTLMQRLRLTGSPIQHSHCLERFRRLLERMQVGVPVRLLQSALIEVPTLMGWLRPTILVPASVLVGLTPDQLDAILAHELAHVRRYDYLVNLFQTVIETILFYHPAVWWISRKLREERENCCDDIALEVMQDRLVYASALAQLEQGRAMPLALTASGGSLLHRIRRIVGANDRKVSAWPLWVLIIAVLSIACLTKSKAAATTAVSTSQPAAEATGKNPVVMIRIASKVVQIDEDDYQAHSADIDDAVQKGDAASLSDLKSFHLLFDHPILTKSGEQGVMESVRVLPYPIAFKKEADGKFTPTDFKKQNLGVRFVHFPTFTDGKINIKGVLNVTSVEGWTQTDENPHKPIFHVREAPVFESFTSGQTKGFEVPGGAQMEPFDPTAVYFAPDEPPAASQNPKALRRIFFFLTASAFSADGKALPSPASAQLNDQKFSQFVEKVNAALHSPDSKEYKDLFFVKDIPETDQVALNARFESLMISLVGNSAWKIKVIPAKDIPPETNTDLNLEAVCGLEIQNAEKEGSHRVVLPVGWSFGEYFIAESRTPGPGALMLDAVQKGDTAALQKLFDQGLDPNVDLCNPVYWAVYYNQPEILKLLLAHNAETNRWSPPGDTSPIQLARMKHPELASILQPSIDRNHLVMVAKLQAGLKATHIDLPAFSNAPLDQVISSVLQAEKKANPLGQGINFMVPISPAISSARITLAALTDVSILDALQALTKAANLKLVIDEVIRIEPPNTSSPPVTLVAQTTSASPAHNLPPGPTAEEMKAVEDSQTPLMKALQSRQYDQARALLAQGADCNATDKMGLGPLGALLDHSGNDGRFPMDILQTILARMRDPNPPVPLEFCTPPMSTPLLEEALFCATYSNGNDRLGDDRQVVKLLLGHGARFASAPADAQALLQAAALDDLPAMQQLVAKGTSPSAADGDGWTPLLVSIALDYDDAANWLIDHGANVSAPTRRGAEDPLVFATAHGNDVLVEKLIAKGAKPVLRGGDLWRAVDRNDQRLFDDLINAGADPKGDSQIHGSAGGQYFRQIDSDPLFICIAKGQTAMAVTLINKGVDPEPKNVLGNRNFAYWAVVHDRPQILRALLDHGANPLLKDEAGETPLSLAQKSHPDLVPMLQAAAQKIAPKSETSAQPPDATSADEAVFYQALERDRILVADSSVTSSTLTADAQMLVAIQKGDVAALKKVLEHAVDPNTFDPDRFYSCPVYWAVHFNQPEILKMLLEHFATGDLGPAHETPLQLAQRTHPDLIPIIEEAIKRNRALLTARLTEKLHSIHIDLPAFSGAPLSQVTKFLLDDATAKAGYLDRRVNIGTMDIPPSTIITSPARPNIPIWDALQTIADANKLRFDVDGSWPGNITLYPPRDEAVIHPPAEKTEDPPPASVPTNEPLPPGNVHGGGSYGASSPPVDIAFALVEVDEKAYRRNAAAMDDAVRRGDQHFFENRKDAFVYATDSIKFPTQKGWYSMGEVISYIDSAKTAQENGKPLTTLTASSVFLGFNGDFVFSHQPGAVLVDSSFSQTELIGYKKLAVDPNIPPDDARVPQVHKASAIDKNWKIEPGKTHGLWIGATYGQLKLISRIGKEGVRKDEMIKSQSPSRLAIFMTPSTNGLTPQPAPSTNTTDSTTQMLEPVDKGAAPKVDAGIKGTDADSAVPWPLPDLTASAGFFPLAATGEVVPPSDTNLNESINNLTLGDLDVTDMPMQSFLPKLAELLKKNNPDSQQISFYLMVPKEDKPYQISLHLDQKSNVRSILDQLNAQYPIRYEIRGIDDIVVWQVSHFEAAFNKKAQETQIRVDLEHATLTAALKAVQTAAAAKGMVFNIANFDNANWFPPNSPLRVTLQKDSITVDEALRFILETGHLRLGFEQGKYLVAPTQPDVPMKVATLAIKAY